jgi:hypothetical protein
MKTADEKLDDFVKDHVSCSSCLYGVSTLFGVGCEDPVRPEAQALLREMAEDAEKANLSSNSRLDKIGKIT